MRTFQILLILFCFCACKKNDEIVYYGNEPFTDSTSIGYRLSDIYWNDTSLNQLATFHFKYDSISTKAWTQILIEYELSQGTFTSTYSAEYANGQLVKLKEIDNGFNIIELFYTKLEPNYTSHLTYIKFLRDFSPFALKFEYDSTKLVKVTKYELNIAGVETRVLESKNVCMELYYGMCDTSAVNYAYQKDYRINSFYNCKEIAPVFLLLSKPYQNKLDDISADLPLLFSKFLPASKLKSNFGTYELGINNEKEPNFIYFRPYRARYPEGYNFVYNK